ncbi:MAG TPA: START domain-containing protein [Puia sp.]|nr:START domain-containing protein [Puia sp.]
MPRKAAFIVITLLFSCWIGGYGQENWELKTENEGIRVYTRTFPDSKFKAIRVHLELQATLSQIVALLMDVNEGTQWVYATKTSVLLKQISPNELVYYSEVRLPWPMANRDFIARLRATQDAKTKVVTIDGPVVPDYVPVKDGIVRVTRSMGQWIITPVGSHHVRLVYTLRTDPGGDIPAWLFNLFVTKGPTESFKKLQTELRKPVYEHAHLDYIED